MSDFIPCRNSGTGVIALFPYSSLAVISDRGWFPAVLSIDPQPVSSMAPVLPVADPALSDNVIPLLDSTPSTPADAGVPA